MNRLIVPLVVGLALGCGNTAIASDAEFEALSSRFLDDLPTLSPVYATLAGDHRADGELDDVDAAAWNGQALRYRQYQQTLNSIDRDSLTRANQVDYELLRNRLEYEIWQIETLQEWAWNPLVYVRISGSGIYDLMAREYGPVEDRLLAAASRMEQLPRFFEQARTALDPARIPRVHAETAAAQNKGLNSIIDNMVVPRQDELTPAARARVQAAIGVAGDAISSHQAWLEQEVVPRATADFRAGAEAYDARLAFVLESGRSRRDIRTLAEAEYTRVREAMYEVAKQVYLAQHPFTAIPDRPDEAYKQVVIRAALDLAQREMPPRDGIVDFARSALQQATDFVTERNLVTLPEEPVEIITMPEFRRGVSVAYLDAPGPLEPEQPAFYAVAPLPTDWTEEQSESFLREYNLLAIQDLTFHEGVPGHYVQLAHSHRYPSLLRGFLASGTFIEGWAVYAERVMIDAGYLDKDPLMRLVNLKWYLRSVVNAIIDSAIHVDGMTRDEAMRLMIEGGFQEEREAAGKWTRAQLTFTQLSTYFVGYQEHVAMRRAVEAAWGDEFTLRRYHDQVLSYGSPPVKYVQALVLNLEIPD